MLLETTHYADANRQTECLLQSTSESYGLNIVLLNCLFLLFLQLNMNVPNSNEDTQFRLRRLDFSQFDYFISYHTILTFSKTLYMMYLARNVLELTHIGT